MKAAVDANGGDMLNESTSVLLSTLHDRKQCKKDTITAKPHGRVAGELHRVSSREFVIELEHGLIQFVDSSWSWKSIMRDKKNAQGRPSNPFDWPRLNLCSDGGLDILCALNFTVRQTNCNVDWFPGSSHIGKAAL